MLKLWPNDIQTAIWIRLWLHLTNGTIAKQIVLAALNTNVILITNQLGLSCLPIYHTGPYWNVWQVVSCDFMVTSLVVSSCCWAFSMIHCHSGANYLQWAGSIFWTEHQHSSCVVDSPPFLNRVLWYCRRIIQSFSSSKLLPVQAVYIILFSSLTWWWTQLCHCSMHCTG